MEPHEDRKRKADRAGLSDMTGAASRSEDYDSSDLDSDNEEGSKVGSGEPRDELSRLRREKRLAMNRESARARRKRKKVLLETLEQQVSDLTKQNQRYRITNETLTLQVAQLENDLALAKSTIAVLSNQSSNLGMRSGSLQQAMGASQGYGLGSGVTHGLGSGRAHGLGGAMQGVSGMPADLSSFSESSLGSLTASHLQQEQLRRAMQARLLVQQGHGINLGGAAASFDAHRALELQTMSQFNRERAVSMMNALRSFGHTTQSLAGLPVSHGIHLEPDQNAVSANRFAVVVLGVLDILSI
jgi:hypothetical protein